MAAALRLWGGGHLRTRSLFVLPDLPDDVHLAWNALVTESITSWEVSNTESHVVPEPLTIVFDVGTEVREQSFLYFRDLQHMKTRARTPF